MIIEFGLTGNDRKELVKAVSEIIGVPAEYQYMPTCAYIIGRDYTITKEGNLEISDSADSKETEHLLAELKSRGYDVPMAEETAEENSLTVEIEVPFKASAAVPRLYRLKFHRDIYKDFASLKTDVAEGDENKSELDIESLEVFENIAYIMAKHADPENVPDSPDDFLERFNTFSIYEILPQLIELWGLNTAVQVESKKNIARLTDR